MARICGWALVGAGLLAAGCTNDPGFIGVPGIRETDAASVASCKYLTDITGTPSVFGPLASEGLKYSHNQILAEARDSGADTVVFDKVAPGTDVYRLHAVAYRCGT
ncbi:MAG: hypothetical protein JSR87_00890 [Proteobacteria bacterium]|nr:hypothetical protein [Pseudomonadota bacterium]MBS0572392.1 hypothetical protein [Pseudomonadota bacterium]